MKKIFTLSGLSVIAAAFHLTGLSLILLRYGNLVKITTPYHLLLMFLLLAVSFGKQRKHFLKWLPLAYITGYGIEWIGVHKGWLFGNYGYGDVLGISWQEVPLLIGINWVLVLSGASSLAGLLNSGKWTTALIAAALATGYDFVLEPVAIKLGYWHWTGGTVPLFNYACWGLFSFLLALLWHYCRLKPNQFAVNLFIIQLLFFALLRSLL